MNKKCCHTLLLIIYRASRNAWRCLWRQHKCKLEVGCVIANAFHLQTKTKLRNGHGCVAQSAGRPTTVHRASMSPYEQFWGQIQFSWVIQTSVEIIMRWDEWCECALTVSWACWLWQLALSHWWRPNMSVCVCAIWSKNSVITRTSSYVVIDSYMLSLFRMLHGLS